MHLRLGNTGRPRVNVLFQCSKKLICSYSKWPPPIEKLNLLSSLWYKWKKEPGSLSSTLSLSEKTPWQPAISLLNHYIHCHNHSGSAWGDRRQKYIALFSPEANSTSVILTPQIQSSPWHFKLMTLAWFSMALCVCVPFLWLN